VTALVAAVTIAAIAPIVVAEASESIVEATKTVVISLEATEAIVVAEAARPVVVAASKTRIIIAEIAHRTRAGSAVAIVVVVTGLARDGDEAQRCDRNGDRHVSDVLRLHALTLRRVIEPTRMLRGNENVTGHRLRQGRRRHPIQWRMKKKTKKATKGLGKSMRKAVKRHSIATGVLTGAATAVALSTTGATKKMSEAVGTGVAGLLKAGGRRGEMLRGLRKATADALVRAGRSLQPGTTTEAATPATDGKTSTTTRRSAASRTSA
jgi:hypothetical protein